MVLDNTLRIRGPRDASKLHQKDEAYEGKHIPYLTLDLPATSKSIDELVCLVNWARAVIDIQRPQAGFVQKECRQRSELRCAVVAL